MKLLVTVKGITVECKDEVKVLGVYIDSWLTFSKQISVIYQKPGKQTGSIMQSSTINGMECKISIYHAFILSNNFNYCPVVWMLCGQGNVTKMEHVQLKPLRFVLNDFTSSYTELLQKCEQPSISIHLIRSLVIWELWQWFHQPHAIVGFW